MKTTTLSFLFTLLVGVVLCNIAGNPQYSAPERPSQDVEVSAYDQNISDLFLELLKSLVTKLINYIKKLIVQATGTFKVAFQNKLHSDDAELRARIGQISKNFAYKNKNSGAAATECMMVHSIEAETVLNSSMAIAMSCAESRQTEINRNFSNMIKKLREASEISKNALKEMWACFKIASGANSNFFCLGSLALKTQKQAISFLEKYGLLLTHFNTAMSTFPAALDECAERHLVEAGNAAAAIAADIKSCVAVSDNSKLLRDGVSSSSHDNSGDDDSDDDNQNDDEDDNNEDSNGDDDSDDEDNNGDDNSDDDNEDDDDGDGDDSSYFM